MVNLKGAKTMSAEEGKRYSSAVDVLKDFDGDLRVSFMSLRKGTEEIYLPAMYRTIGTDNVTNQKVTLQGVTFECAAKSDGIPKVFLDRLVDEKSSPIWLDKNGYWISKGLWKTIENSTNIVEFTEKEYALLSVRNDDGTGKDPIDLDGYTVEYYYATINASRKGRVVSFGGTIQSIGELETELTLKGRQLIENKTEKKMPKERK